MSTSLRLGTRGSALALAQSGLVAARLRALGWDVELVPIQTDGDRLTGPLTQIGGTGVFVVALREAVLDGRCDLAVHSLKDLPVADHDGVRIAAVPERADPRDALCARSGWTLAGLPAGARIGTGSPRRAAQLRLVRGDLDVVDIRGNVDTRLGRLEDSGPRALDAVVLAVAGLSRLGRLAAVTEVLEPDVMTPAPGQGALALECRADDVPAGLASFDHPATRLEVTAERALLARLEAGCTAPVGALARMGGGERAGGGGRALELSAVVVRADGVALRAHGRAELDGEVAERDLESARDLGIGLAERLLADGADQGSHDGADYGSGGAAAHDA